MAAPTAIKSVLNKQEKKQVKNIAKNQVNKLAPGLSVARADAAANADAVGGQSLANIATARSDPTTGGQCDPNSTAFAACASVDLNLPHQGRVLLLGTGAQYAFNAGVTQGTCRLTLDGAALGGSSVVLGNQTDASPGVTGAANRGYARGFSTTIVTDPVSSGPHSFGLECNETDADVEFENPQMTAAVLGSG
ncbi:MAG TPA: hypothetical protein VFN15_03225 [Solirubrobacterales bacterium]|nr:hypothetical protein [Solirubrobacterales bacterium]